MGRSTGHTELGMIAQDIEKSYPELVTYWKEAGSTEAYRGVDYERFTAVLLEAIKELKTQNESMKKEVGFLKGRVEVLEKK